MEPPKPCTCSKPVPLRRGYFIYCDACKGYVPASKALKLPPLRALRRAQIQARVEALNHERRLREALEAEKDVEYEKKPNGETYHEGDCDCFECRVMRSSKR